MKRMKTILSITVLLLIAVNVAAQQKRVTFGFKAGLNISKLESMNQNEGFDNTRFKIGGHAGIMLDYVLVNDVHLFSGLEYTAKGVKVDKASDYPNWDIRAAYLQLPVSVGYKYRITDKFAVAASMGTFFAYGLHGESRSDGWVFVLIDTFRNEMMRRFDCGMLGGVSLEWKKLYFGLGVEEGIINIMQSGTKAKSRNFTVSAGWFF